MTFFKNIELQKADPILGLSSQFQADQRAEKVNLTVGIYCDENGKTPTFDAVRRAELALYEEKPQKNYLPIIGTPAYREAVKQLVFGEAADNVTVAYAPGGTGGLRMTAELLKKANSDITVWVSSPTWGNHFGILDEAGVAYQTYPYGREGEELNLTAIFDSLENAKAGDAVLMHGVCHNPTGIDPTLDQWNSIFDFLERKQLIPFFDIAYHGFGVSQEVDIQPIRNAYARFPECFVVYSFSKVLGLYGERVGAVVVKCADASVAEKVQSNLMRIARCNYSNPPIHGIKVAEKVLNDAALTQNWIAELESCQSRIATTRTEFGNKLAAAGLSTNGIESQKGIFSFLPISPVQAQTLRSDYAIYLLDNGRVNVAGVNSQNIDYVIESIKAVSA